MTRPAIDFAALMPDMARALLGEPNARLRTAREFRYGSHGSLAVHVGGEYAGTWRDHEADEGGGVLALVMRERGGSEREAMAWLRATGLLDGAGEKRRANGNDFRAPSRSRRTGPAPSSKPRDTTAAARRVWESTEALPGSAAAEYLAERHVSHVAGAPALRFHPGLRHRDHPPGILFPTLVAGLQDIDGRIVGIQRTFLAENGGKANVAPVRASLGGSLAGGAVRLGEPEHGRLLVCEGIESTAAAMAIFDLPG